MTKRAMPAQPEWLSAMSAGSPIGVDKDAKIIRGYIVAELGPFKTPGRGKFSAESLSKVVSLMNQKQAGVKVRFTHPGLSSDGMGKFLGRGRDAWVDMGTARTPVRANLHLSEAAFTSPEGNLGQYVMDLAENDPEAFGSSLVLQVDKTWDKDAKGKDILYDDDGNDIAPLWMPRVIHASDIVDDGDAVHSGFLSAGTLDLDALPDAIQRQGWEMLDRLFGGQSREVCESRCMAYLQRYLDSRYGANALERAMLSGKPSMPPVGIFYNGGVHPQILKRRLRLAELRGSGPRHKLQPWTEEGGRADAQPKLEQLETDDVRGVATTLLDEPEPERQPDAEGGVGEGGGENQEVLSGSGQTEVQEEIAAQSAVALAATPTPAPAVMTQAEWEEKRKTHRKAVKADLEREKESRRLARQPVVNITVAPPNVNILMPDQPPAVVNIAAAPPMRKETRVDYDGQGNVIGSTTEEVPCV